MDCGARLQDTKGDAETAALVFADRDKPVADEEHVLQLHQLRARLLRTAAALDILAEEKPAGSAIARVIRNVVNDPKEMVLRELLAAEQEREHLRARSSSRRDRIRKALH